MNTADKISELIEQMATIKEKFHQENSLGFSSYDWRERKRKTSCMQIEKISDVPEFMKEDSQRALSFEVFEKE